MIIISLLYTLGMPKHSHNIDTVTTMMKDHNEDMSEVVTYISQYGSLINMIMILVRSAVMIKEKMETWFNSFVLIIMMNISVKVHEW